MLTRLKKLIKLLGIVQVTNDLGYRTPTTILKWIKKNEIPSIATGKVKTYLGQKGV